MKCGEVIELLTQLAPPEYACEWDNPGLLAGREEKEVKRILVAVDATDAVVALAAEKCADLLLTHHPLIFKGIKKINDQDFIGRRLLTLIGRDICCYAMHTNFDIAPGCMADLAAERLELSERRPLEVTGTDPDGNPVGIGKVGRLGRPMTAAEVGRFVKERFGLPYVTAYGLEEVRGRTEVIAVSPGSGGSVIQAAVRSGAGVLVTGDIGHHEGIDAAACGLAVIDAGHYGLEHIFVEFMTEYLNKHLGDRAEVLSAPLEFPAAVL